jgi:tetratricopeptide (TPR) repeat protein
MKWTSWMLLAASLGLLLAVGLMVARQSRQTPREEFKAIERRVSQGNYDRERTISQFNQVLIRAEDARDSELAGDIRLARGRLLMQVGSFERARNDLTIVWEERRGDRTVERLLVDLERRAGDYRASLQRIDHLLEADPTHAEDWRTKGDLHRAAAEKSIAQYEEISAKNLVPDVTAKVSALLEHMSGLDPEDPRRVSIGHDLRDMFDYANEQLGERALSTADAASRDFSEARRALSRSLVLQFDAGALASLVEILKRAGHTTEAIDLCTAAWRVPAVRSEARMATFMVEALSELGRPRHASDVATYWINRGVPMTSEFYLDCCRLLAQSRQWGPLLAAINQLTAIASPAEIETCLFYQGLISSASGDYVGGRFNLLRYLSSKAPEPFPGARAVAWREIARCARGLGQAQNEREALEEAVDLEPDHDGETWLRLCELQLATPHGGYRIPETRWAKGMSLLPDRISDLLPRWREIGELELKALGIDLAAQQSQLVSERTWIPSPEAGPYELFRLARLQIDDGDIPRAQNSIKRLLEIVPGFPPGLDLAVEVAQKVGKQRDVIAALLERMKVTGVDDRARGILAKIQPDFLAPKDILVLMRASPDRFGRLSVARTYYAHGEIERALSTLEGLPADGFGIDGKILQAELELRMQRPEKALEALAPLGQVALLNDDGLDAFVGAALGIGDFERLTRAMMDLSSSPAPNKPRWLALCDRMLQSGATAPARALLKRLDSQAKTRGGDVLMRLAATALAEGNAKQLAQLLDRAQVFDDQGESEHFNLLARASEGRFDELKQPIAALRAGRYRPSRLESVLLDVMSDQTIKARSVIDSALQTDPRDAQWQLASAVLEAMVSEPWTAPPYFGREAASETERFVTGTTAQASDESSSTDKSSARSPRWAACVLFAMQSPLTRAWAQAQLRATATETHGDLWPLYFRATLSRNAGDLFGARKMLELVVARVPDFGPAWDLLEDLALARRDDAQALSELRLRRTQAMGEQSISLGMQWLDKARLLQSKGDLDGALEAVKSAAALDPDSPRILAKQGELLAARGEFGPALTAYRSACAAKSAGDSTALRHAFLRVLDEAERTVPPAITSADHMADLEKLALAAPDDPFIPIAMARLDVKVDPQNPSFSVARAYNRLERFRLRHKDRSLESLGPGSAEEWVEFQLALDPARAEALLQSELELEPGAIAPWLLLGRVYTIEGKTRDAIQQFTLCFGLAPRKSVMREYARARVWSEMTVESVASLLHQVQEDEGLTKPDEELVGLAARALFNMGPRGIVRAAALLDSYGTETDISPSAIERIGLLRALVWATRAQPEDLERARKKLGAILPLVVDPYRKTVVTALTGIVQVPVEASTP